MKKKVLVTGGAGYIGSHTLVDLIENGYEVVSIDDLSRGDQSALDGVESITGQKVSQYQVNLCDLEKTKTVFEEHPDITGVIHFAAFKSVPESVSSPLEYYHNNLTGLNNILSLVKEFQIPHFVFSSSCSVYGNTDVLPVTEDTPFGEAESPYARTKQMGEFICRDFAKAYSGTNVILLRYFNPAGAHPTAIIGDTNKMPENIVPIITQTAKGIRPSMQIYGNDYPTKDGTCVRDYIHVMDIAHAHTLAIEYANQNKDISVEVFNLGTGQGVSVQELLHSFEKATQVSLNYTVGPRRAGDVIEIYANNEKAKAKLNWHIKYTLEDMMTSAWLWQNRD